MSESVPPTREETRTSINASSVNGGNAASRFFPQRFGENCPLSPSSVGGFRPTSLQRYGISGTSSLPVALREREALCASFSVLSLSEDGDKGKETSLPLAALTSGLEDASEMLDLLSRTSLWGQSTCGEVSARSWCTPALVKGIQNQLRLAVFLNLRAVIVPLPDFSDDGSGDSADFAAAVATLTEHLRLSQTTNIWVRCDASCRAQRVVFSRLRTALLWGSTPPSATEAAARLSRRLIHRVMPYLYFSENVDSLLSEWLGESVFAFNVPSVDKLTRAIRSEAGVFCNKMPSDVTSLISSYWATTQPPFISLGSFVVELLRRRALPVFSSDRFMESYNLLNLLYEEWVADDARDFFAGFEDVLQLPLQPLGDMLPSEIYEVFEQDRTKYQHYYYALRCYFHEWLAYREERSHVRICSRASDEFNSDTVTDALYIFVLGAGRGPLIEECLNVANGLGVRIHLLAVDKNPEAVEFVRLRLSADTQWLEWINRHGHIVEVMHGDGRAISGLMANVHEKGSHISHWRGLCDLVVSELLGSFGDNELSPECLDDFYDDLLRYQSSMGVPVNPYLTSMPQQYTAWIAPLHSGWVEEAVAEAAIPGLTVPPPCCHDPHAAVFHSIFVCNACRGVMLAPPKACWTFRHFLPTGQRKEQETKLNFYLCGGGRCCGFIGFFTAVLFAPSAMQGEVDETLPLTPVTISTASQGRTPRLFSWFPCIFPMEPRDMLEVQAGNVLQLHLRRCVDTEEKRMWYSYNTTLLVDQGASVTKPSETAAVINDFGWAASVSLSS